MASVETYPHLSALTTVQRVSQPWLRKVIKRDGRSVDWDISRVIRAVALSFYDLRNNDQENPYRDDPSHFYGLNTDDYSRSVQIARSVDSLIDGKYYRQGSTPTIEQIQDAVEMAIIMNGDLDAARKFMRYRDRRNETRLVHYDQVMMSDYLRTAKYMRHRDDLKRRETLDEAVDRVWQMHVQKYGVDQTVNPAFALSGELEEAFDAVRRLELWPSSRSMQFGGKPILLHEAKLFNCTYSPVTRVEFFREYIYLLLCGCGCGFSVQWHHVNQLPEFPRRDNPMELEVKHFTIPDTIAGWGDAVHELLMAHLRGYHIEFNYSKIRPRGAKLKTSGGKAPGHLPLKKALEETAKILTDAAGRKLKPIEVYDICMHLSQAVLSGGIRRSASICLFSHDDGEMMTAKTSQNYNPKTGPNKQRSASNNSAVLLRSTVDRETFSKIFATQKDFGEPGFYFLEDLEYGTNPCVEIGLNPMVRVDHSNIDDVRTMIQEYEARIGPYTINCEPLDGVEHGDVLYGWHFCNLTSINGGKVKSKEDFFTACRRASVIGTFQAGYTNIPYIGPVSQYVNEREALLGVSISGIMDNPWILLDPPTLREGARIVNETNQRVAKILGHEPAARTTCIKPDGTVAKVFMCASGVHPHPARRYFRRVQANRNETPLQFLKAQNPSMVEPSLYGLGYDDVITFPIEAPAQAIVSKDLTPINFLDAVQTVMENWVIPGSQYDTYSPGLQHNVSNTVHYNPDNPAEVRAIEDWIWDHRHLVTGISLGPKISQRFPQAPNEEIEDNDQIERWNRMGCRPVDYSLMYEDQDGTNLKENIACAGGQCEL